MRKRLAILTVAAVLPLTGGASLAVATQAGAAPPPPPQVTVTGKVAACEGGSDADEVSIETSKETKAVDLKGSNKYTIVFKKIPKAGRDATATVTCEDGNTYTDEFNIKGHRAPSP